MEDKLKYNFDFYKIDFKFFLNFFISLKIQIFFITYKIDAFFL